MQCMQLLHVKDASFIENSARAPATGVSGDAVCNLAGHIFSHLLALDLNFHSFHLEFEDNWACRDGQCIS